MSRESIVREKSRRPDGAALSPLLKKPETAAVSGRSKSKKERTNALRGCRHFGLFCAVSACACVCGPRAAKNVCVVCVSVWEGACFDFRGCFKFLRHVSAQHAGNNKTPLTHSVIHARRTSCVWTIKIAGNVQFGEKASLNKVICHYTLF